MVIIRLREWKTWFFLLCPNQMIQVSIYREKKIMNFGKKNKKNKKIICNEIIESKVLRW